MKKVQYLIYILNVFLISSCLSDDSMFIIKSDNAEISFVDPFTQKNTTRALGDINNTNLKESKFKVWGSYANPGSSSYTSVFNGTEIHSVNGLWIYDQPVKWETDKNYRFAALAPTDVIKEGTYYYGNSGFTITSIPLCVEASQAIDYLVSDLTETNYENSGSSGVQINFKHILSKLKINLKYSNEDNNLLKVRVKELSIKLPKGSAKYEQIDIKGSSTSDIWTFPSDISNTSYSLISEETEAQSEYVSLGDGFFMAPMSYDVNAKMDISYSIDLLMGSETKTIEVDKKDISLNQLTSFTQGCITNLMLNIKPTGSDYAYIEIHASQQVAEHEADNGYIDEKGRAFTIASLSQSGDKLIANINTLGNDPTGVHYFLKSVVDEDGKEQLSGESEFEYVTDKDGLSSFSVGVNALLESETDYTFTIQDIKGNEQKFTYATTARLGGASMIWTIQIPSGSKSMALDIPIDVSGTLPFTVRVEWGDNTESLITKGSALSIEDGFYHKYSATGEYKVTITSAVADYTKQQFLPFSFYQYRRGINKYYNENQENTYYTYRLISVDTPLLNMGTAKSENLFRGCKALKTVHKDLFIYNSMITHMNLSFYSCALSEIPSGLFDPLENVKEFNETFRGCNNLVKIPKGLFAKNLKAYSFYLCFLSCDAATIHSYIFINSDDERETRFADLTQAVDFTQTFAYCDAGGTAPDLWNYKYGAGYTWTRGETYAPFSYNSDITIFSNWEDIPETWIKGHPDTSEGWVYPN